MRAHHPQCGGIGEPEVLIEPVSRILPASNEDVSHEFEEMRLVGETQLLPEPVEEILAVVCGSQPHKVEQIRNARVVHCQPAFVEIERSKCSITHTQRS